MWKLKKAKHAGLTKASHKAAEPQSPCRSAVPFQAGSHETASI